MTASYTPRVKMLLHKAKNVADLGKRPAAEQLYRELTQEAPDVADGWLGLGKALQDETEKKASFTRALELDPTNEYARAWLNGEPLPVEKEPEPVAPEPEPLVDVEKVKQAAQSVLGDDFGIAASEPEPAADAVVGLRCNRCDKPLVGKEAVPTSVGYRCKACIHEIEESYYTAIPMDYVLAGAVALPLGLLGAFIIGQILGDDRFFTLFIVLILSTPIGTAIGTAVSRVISRRRGRFIPSVVSACVWTGALLALPFSSGWIGLAIFAFSASSAAFYRLR